MSPFTLRQLLLSTLAIGFIVVGLGYGGFEARRLVAGPQVEVLSPATGSATSSSHLLLTGVAHNISFLTVNGQQAYTDESGRFALLVAPSPGYAAFEVAGTDRFGRRTSKEVHITILNFCPIQTYG